MQEAPAMKSLFMLVSVAAIALVAGTFATVYGVDEPSRIDQVLARWETQAAGWRTINVRFTREDHEVAWGTRNEFAGTLLVKDAETAAVDFAKPGDPATLVECLVWVNSEIRQFDAKTRQIFLFPRPKDIPSRLPDAICLPFLFGRKAAELKRDYDIHLVNEKEKSYVIRFDAKNHAAAPTLPKGDLFARIAWTTQWFHAIYIELDKETMLPRALVLVDPNGKDRKTYRVTSIRLNEPIPEAVFEVRAVKGWKVIVNPARAN
jgi:hypothetical protein